MTAPVPGAGQDGERLVTDIVPDAVFERVWEWVDPSDPPNVPLSRRRLRRGLAAVAPDIAADADQRWTTELTAQADRYASVGTEIADAMAEALRTAVRIMEETEQG